MRHGVFLVEDHKVLRDGVKAILERTGDFDVIGEAENGMDAVTLCRKLRPDLVLMDIGLPGINGIGATTEILRSCPDTRVVILSMHDDENTVIAAFRAGVRGFLLKEASMTELLDALRTVSKGGSYLSSNVSNHLLTRIQSGDLELRGLSALLDSLSPRERQLLQLIAEGKASKEIATMMDLSLYTVRSYRKTLMKKIGATNVAAVTQVAVRARLTGWNGQDAFQKP